MLSLKNQIVWYRRTQWALGIATLLVCACFYVFGYRPQQQRLQTLNTKISRDHAELLGTQTKTRVLPSVSAEVKMLRDRLGRFKTISKQHEVGQFLQEMDQVSRQASVKNVLIREDISSGAGWSGDRISRKSLDISFEGDFVSIFSFLRSTEDMQRLTRIPSLTIKAKDRTGNVKVSMKMNIYFQVQ